MSPLPQRARLMWLDLEMTGLDPRQDVILQIGFGFTNVDLSDADDVAVTDLVIAHAPDTLSRMTPNVREMHNRSGLAVKLTSATLSLSQVEDLVLHAMRREAPERSLVLAGNSIWVDRTFLLWHMPRVEHHLHYQQVDVTSLKLLAEAWFPSLPAFSKKEAHTAESDVLESIQELKYYRQLLGDLTLARDASDSL